MLKDITLGQYFPGKSVIHRLDPRTKLIMLVVYIVALFSAVSWISYGVLAVFLVSCIAASGVPVKSFVKGLKPLLFILAFVLMRVAFAKTPNTLISAEECEHKRTEDVGSLLPGEKTYGYEDGERCFDCKTFLGADQYLPTVQIHA